MREFGQSAGAGGSGNAYAEYFVIIGDGKANGEGFEFSVFDAVHFIKFKGVDGEGRGEVFVFGQVREPEEFAVNGFVVTVQDSGTVTKAHA